MNTQTETHTANRHAAELIELEPEVIASIKATRHFLDGMLNPEDAVVLTCELMLISPEGCVRAGSLTDLEPLEKLYHALGLVIGTIKGHA